MPGGGGPVKADSPNRPSTASRRPGSARRARPGTARISKERTIAPSEQANPSPKIAPKSGDINHVEESFNEAKLQAIANTDNLSAVTKLKVEVNTTESSLGRFGQLLPNLIDLDLRNSKISSIRDLGTTLGRITVLRLSNCGITDLSGVSTLAALKDVSLAYNSISVCSPLTMLSDLQTLNIQNNAVVEQDEIGYLGLCMSLVNLTLANNPFHASFNGDDAKYKEVVMDAAPQLESLDARLELPPPPTKVVDAYDVADAAAEAAGGARPGTAGSGGRPSTGTGTGAAASARPGTAGSGGKPSTAGSGGRPGTIARPTTASRRAAGRPGSGSGSSEVDGATAAAKPDTTLFQGNPLKALRARKASRGVEEVEDPESLDALLASVGLGPADEYVEDYDYGYGYDGGAAPPSQDKDSVFSDLRSWHSNYSRQSAAIESSGIGSSKAVMARVSLSGGKDGRSSKLLSSRRTGVNKGGGRPPPSSAERPPRGAGRAAGVAAGDETGGRRRGSSASVGDTTPPRKSGKGGKAKASAKAARSGSQPTPPRRSDTNGGSGSGSAHSPQTTPQRVPRPPKHSPKPPGGSGGAGGARRARTTSGLRRQRLRSVDSTAPETPPSQAVRRPPIRPFSGPAELPTMAVSRDATNEVA